MSCIEDILEISSGEKPTFMPLNPTTIFERDGETIDRVDDMPHINDPGFRQLLEHWASLRDRAGGVLPKRIDLDPVAFPKALAIIWIYERVRDADGRLRYICRLSGEDVRLRYEQSIMGQYLDSFISPDILPLVEAHYRFLLDDGGIGWSRGTIYLKSIGRPGVGMRILLPMADEDGIVPSFIVGASQYEPWVPIDDTEPEPDTPSQIVRYVIPFEVYDRVWRG